MDKELKPSDFLYFHILYHRCDYSIKKPANFLQETPLYTTGEPLLGDLCISNNDYFAHFQAFLANLCS